MLSFFFLGGVVAGGAMMGLGLIARSLPGGAERSERVRALAVLIGAYGTGLGFIACVIALLALFMATGPAGGAAAAASALVPAAILGVPSLAMCRPAGRQGVRGITSVLTMFAAGLGLVVVVVAVLAMLLETDGGATDWDPIVMALGLVAAGAAAGIGYLGSLGVKELSSSTVAGTDVDAAAIRARTMTRAAIVEGIVVVTLVVALLLLVLSE